MSGEGDTAADASSSAAAASHAWELDAARQAAAKPSVPAGCGGGGASGEGGGAGEGCGVGEAGGGDGRSTVPSAGGASVVHISSTTDHSYPKEAPIDDTAPPKAIEGAGPQGAC